MARPPDIPSLTPQFCFSPTALQDFLRLSRSAIDDAISQNLNALPAAATTPPDGPPSSGTPPRFRMTRRTLDPRACAAFRDRVLFPAWHARSAALDFCARVSALPDPDDPDAEERRREADRAGARVVDERLDPYSARFFARESRAERLARTVAQERAVEDIVRARSWDVVRGRCGGVGGEAAVRWQKEMDGWRQRTGEGKG